MTALGPMDSSVDVTVSLVNWNGARWIESCLQSLRQVKGLRLEILLVDNASSDESVELVRRSFTEVRIIQNASNRGFARANNQVFNEGRGRYFFLLNNDAALYEACLESLVEFMETHPNVGIASGRLENPDRSVQFSYYPVTLPSLRSITADLLWLNRIWPRANLGRGRKARLWDDSRPAQMEQLPGACILIRREVLDQVGLFDERFEFWYEDVDLCHRAGKAGWELWYLPQARILHHGGGSSALLDASTRSQWRFRNMLRYARIHFPAVRWILLRIVVATILILRLPLVVLAGSWSALTGQEKWRGAWKAYLLLLRDVVCVSGLDELSEG